MPICKGCGDCVEIVSAPDGGAGLGEGALCGWCLADALAAAQRRIVELEAQNKTLAAAARQQEGYAADAAAATLAAWDTCSALRSELREAQEKLARLAVVRLQADSLRAALAWLEALDKPAAGGGQDEEV